MSREFLAVLYYVLSGLDFGTASTSLVFVRYEPSVVFSNVGMARPALDEAAEGSVI